MEGISEQTTEVICKLLSYYGIPYSRDMASKTILIHGRFSDVNLAIKVIDTIIHVTGSAYRNRFEAASADYDMIDPRALGALMRRIIREYSKRENMPTIQEINDRISTICD